MVMNLYLIRHGETDWNRQGLRQGHTDIPLNDTGRAQAAQAADLLAGLCLQVELVFASPLARAAETARIAAARLGFDPQQITVEPQLIEQCFGIAEGTPVEELRRRYPQGQCPGMEPKEALLARTRAVCRAVWDTAARAGAENVLVVSHYVILSAMIGFLTVGRLPRTHMEQGAVYRLQWNGSASASVTKYTQQEQQVLL